jgi:N-acetylmuramoyl-L-alanine amidase
MKSLFLALTLSLLAGCATGPRIDDSLRSTGHDSRVRFIVLHYTTTPLDPALKILLGNSVSCHYVINDNPPTIYRIVDESRRSFHAGVSSWRRYTQLNESSIGIEIVNLGLYRDAEGREVWADYPEPQLEAVMELVKDIVKRHRIRFDHIVGHSDIAPQRKIDPGPRFPWKRLADAGLIKWPDAAKVAERLPGYERELPEIEWFQLLLRRHGFEVPLHGELDPATRNVVRAFQMKYRPAKHDGLPDAETAAILDALVNS